jgi:predicted TIM-barrel fold metal-dependent hydrolase
MWDAEKELSRFNEINLTKEEREMIFSKNIKKLLKM